MARGPWGSFRSGLPAQVWRLWAACIRSCSPGCNSALPARAGSRPDLRPEPSHLGEAWGGDSDHTLKSPIRSAALGEAPWGFWSRWLWPGSRGGLPEWVKGVPPSSPSPSLSPPSEVLASALSWGVSVLLLLPPARGRLGIQVLLPCSPCPPSTGLCRQGAQKNGHLLVLGLNGSC